MRAAPASLKPPYGAYTISGGGIEEELVNGGKYANSRKMAMARLNGKSKCYVAETRSIQIREYCPKLAYAQKQSAPLRIL